MTTSEKLKEIAAGALDEAKTILVEDGEHLPTVMLMKDNEVTHILMIPHMPNQESKERCYRAVADAAKASGSEAAILINDSYIKIGTLEEIDNGRPYAEDPDARECINVTIIGPQITCEFLTAPYERNPVGDIVFAETLPWAPAVCRMIPQWWNQPVVSRQSFDMN